MEGVGRQKEDVERPACQHKRQGLWVHRRSLSSGAHSRDPVARTTEGVF
jgi:hypothetical protein